MGYMILEESLYHEYPIYDHTDVGEENSFLSGRYLKKKFEDPLIFEIKCPQNDHPGHYFGGVIPVVSRSSLICSNGQVLIIFRHSPPSL